jgi:hypothetical protein
LAAGRAVAHHTCMGRRQAMQQHATRPHELTPGPPTGTLTGAGVPPPRHVGVPAGCPGTRGAWEPPPPRLDTWRRRERPPPRSVAWADWFGRFFPFSTRFSHGSTDSAPVQAPRARFSPGFLLHRLRHLPLHATVLWEGQLHLRKEGGPPLSQVSPYK